VRWKTTIPRVCSLSALARVSGGGELVRLQEYGRSFGDGTCRTAGLVEPAVAEPPGLRSRPRWASGASSKPQNPCSESTRVATWLHTKAMFSQEDMPQTTRKHSNKGWKGQTRSDASNSRCQNLTLLRVEARGDCLFFEHLANCVVIYSHVFFDIWL